MSMFDLPGVMEATKEWNSARDDFSAARSAYRRALDVLHQERVRLARAHKRAEETVAGTKYADVFLWLDELYGDRDSIIAAIRQATEGEGNE